MLTAGGGRGFTLPEILIGLSIVAILLGLGVPSAATYLHAARMNSAAQSYLAGVQLARSEAIRRNQDVEFVLTEVPVETANIADAVVGSATGRNWVVRAPDPTRPPPAFELVEARAMTEGAGSSASPTSIVINGIGAPVAFAGTIAFNGFGGTVDNSNYTLSISNPAGGACAPAGPMRCPDILVPAGGLARICDPTVSVATDTRGC